MTAKLSPYRSSLAGTLLAAREAVMAPLRPSLRAADITEQQWRVLRVLAETESMDARTIARTALLYTPSVTRIVKELTARGWIKRETDPHDARRSVIAITKAGRHLLDATSVHTLKLLDEYVKAFGAKRLNALKAELTALSQILERFAPED